MLEQSVVGAKNNYNLSEESTISFPLSVRRAGLAITSQHVANSSSCRVPVNFWGGGCAFPQRYSGGEPETPLLLVHLHRKRTELRSGNPGCSVVFHATVAASTPTRLSRCNEFRLMPDEFRVVPLSSRIVSRRMHPLDPAGRSRDQRRQLFRDGPFNFAGNDETRAPSPKCFVLRPEISGLLRI